MKQRMREGKKNCTGTQPDPSDVARHKAFRFLFVVVGLFRFKLSSPKKAAPSFQEKALVQLNRLNSRRGIRF